MSVGRICSRIVASVSPQDTVRTAARQMAERDVGTLVVMGGERRSQAVGIITDRDIALRCVARNLDPDQTLVEKVMTAPVETINEYASIEDAARTMAATATRRLVVTGPRDDAVGIVSLDDVLHQIVEETGSIGRLLEQQRPHIHA